MKVWILRGTDGKVTAVYFDAALAQEAIEDSDEPQHAFYSVLTVGGSLAAVYKLLTETFDDDSFRVDLAQLIVDTKGAKIYSIERGQVFDAGNIDASRQAEVA